MKHSNGLRLQWKVLDAYGAEVFTSCSEPIRTVDGACALLKNQLETIIESDVITECPECRSELCMKDMICVDCRDLFREEPQWESEMAEDFNFVTTE